MKKRILCVCAAGLLLVSGCTSQNGEPEVELQPDFTVEAAVQPEYPILTVYTPLTEPEVSVYFDAWNGSTFPRRICWSVCGRSGMRRRPL